MTSKLEPILTPRSVAVIGAGRDPTSMSGRLYRNLRDSFRGPVVQAASGLTVERLASVCRNNSVGFTTVARIRITGDEVVRTSGEAHHATVVVPEDWSAEAAAELAAFVELAINPAYRKRQRP